MPPSIVENHGFYSVLTLDNSYTNDILRTYNVNFEQLLFDQQYNKYVSCQAEFSPTSFSSYLTEAAGVMVQNLASNINFLFNKKKSRNFGHKKGAEVVQKIIETSIKEKNITTSLKGIQITGDDLLQVTHHLSSYNCSFNTYLSACSIIAAMTVFDLSAIDVSTSVDLRRIKGCDQTMCFFTSWLSFEVLRELGDSLSTMIDKVRNEIKHQMINKTYMNNLYHLNDRIRSSTDGEQFVNSFISSRPTLFISNCGNSEKLKTSDASELLELHACATSHSYMGTKDSFTLQVFVIDDEAIFIDLSLPPMANSASYDAFLQQLKGTLISP